MNIQQKNISSEDGTSISYNKRGTGDGLIIVHGAGRTAADYEKLATALDDQYTVYTYDRRGRNASGHITADHSIEKECTDLTMLIKATGAIHIFGHSMGGLIVLETALRHPVNNIAVYEPPISVNNSIPEDFLKAYNRALERKQYEKATALMIKGLQMHESVMLPTWLLTTIIKAMRMVKRKGKKWMAAMAATMPTIPIDLAIAKQLNNTYDNYRTIKSNTLLMAGSKSPDYLRQPADLLNNIIPNSSKLVMDGLYHVAPEENSTEVAQVLKQFFK